MITSLGWWQRGEPAMVWRVLTVLGLWVGFGSTPTLGQPSYLGNGNFDADISGWTFFGNYDGNQGETMEWDGIEGFPDPGALRLSVVDSTFVGPRAASECIETPLNSLWVFEAAAREAPGSVQLSCGLEFLLYDHADCRGEYMALTVNGPIAGTEWRLLTLSYKASDIYRGARATFSMGVGHSANGSCHIDSVRLLGPPSLAVPALDRIGLLALVFALALTGFFFLRRLR